MLAASFIYHNYSISLQGCMSSYYIPGAPNVPFVKFCGQSIAVLSQMFVVVVSGCDVYSLTCYDDGFSPSDR